MGLGLSLSFKVRVRLRLRLRVRVPASCTPKMSSDGWRRSRAHSETFGNSQSKYSKKVSTAIVLLLRLARGTKGSTRVVG